MKKKIVTLSLIAALIAIAIVGGTLAYFTDETGTAVNTFTFGDVDIELTEPNWEEPEAVIPGESYDKDPTITVLADSEACYVRMLVTLDNKATIDTLFTNATDAELAEIFQDYDATVWVPGGAKSDDNTRTYIFYYKEAVAKDDEDTVLDPLFTAVNIPASIECGDLESVHLTIIGQAVQAATFDDAQAAFAATFDAE